MGIYSENYCRRLPIASLLAPSNVLMAPVYGYTNAAFRRMTESLGAGIAFTQMVHAEDLLKEKPQAVENARFDPEEKIKALQLIGRDPKVFRRLMESPLVSNADLIDLNMGCAASEIVRSGRGCALMCDLSRAAKIIEACKAGGKPVSVKCRTGLTKSDIRIREFARMCADAGADMLTVHGRPAECRHEGDVLYEAIGEAKSCVRIPVIGNGGIFSEADAVLMMLKTGADGVMIGRCALENPGIFRVLTGG